MIFSNSVLPDLGNPQIKIIFLVLTLYIFLLSKLIFLKIS